MLPFDEQCDLIQETLRAIPMDGSISVLTGQNGTGKSLIRSQLNFRLKEQKKNVVHSSMALRTGSHAHLGGLGVMLRDDDWNSTSYSTFSSIRTALKSIHGSYLCLDEIEIGCSAETTMGMTAWLNEHLPEALEGTMGCLVITHSPYVIQNLKFDHWFNLDGYKTPEEWLNREIVPVDIEEYAKQQMEFFKYIRDERLEKK